jgi:hypothetical protein
VFAQSLHAGIAGFCGIGLEDGAAGQRSDAENGVDFAVHVGNALRQHAIDLGQRHAATPDTQQLQNFQVLYGLGHHAVVGSHDQQGVVNAHGAGGHGVDEFLVARHVDDAQHIAVGQRAVGITEFYGDAAGFLFLEAIGFHARERTHQRGFAVVDMACGSDDHGVLIVLIAAGACVSSDARCFL